MVYIERYQWCMSSIPVSILCPSNVDKSTQPWPLHASTSLISNTNNDNNPVNTDIISSSVFFSKDVFSFSLDQPYDYYTNKRIEQLYNQMDEKQNSSFIKFINYHLSSKNQNKCVKDLSKDLSNGHILIDLIEIFSSKKFKREHGRTRFHSLTNIQYVLDYLKLHMQHINISPHDIVSGNRKQILALLWIIMKIFDFPSFRITTNKYLFNDNTIFSFGQDRNLLLKWINNLLNKILNKNITSIKDFYLQTWINNEYLSIIIKYLCPLSMKYGTLEYFEYFKQFTQLNFNDQEYFELCLKFSNYCFNTILIIDQTDRTEKYLFRFFSELRQNILFILKSNQIGTLTKINPYIKQLVETITIVDELFIEELKLLNNNDEDYLICTEDKQENSSLIEESTIKIDNIEPPLNTTNIIQEQRLCCQNLSSINENSILNYRSHKIKKKRSTFSSISPSPTNDLFFKIFECLHDSKMLTFKYILIFICICFSILIIFIHK